jgi:hypothetical protein
MTKNRRNQLKRLYVIIKCETKWGEIVNIKDLIANKQQTMGKRLIRWFCDPVDSSNSKMILTTGTEKDGIVMLPGNEKAFYNTKSTPKMWGLRFRMGIWISFEFGVVWLLLWRFEFWLSCSIITYAIAHLSSYWAGASTPGFSGNELEWAY